MCTKIFKLKKKLPLLQDNTELAGFCVFIRRKGVDTPVAFCDLDCKKKKRILIENII